MCTAFVKPGENYIAAFNMDIDPGVWSYDICMNEDAFWIGIKDGETVYRTHGVTASGRFGVLPYMNGNVEDECYSDKEHIRLDLLNQDWLSDKLELSDIISVEKKKKIVNMKGMSMHMLFSDGNEAFLIEPGCGMIKTKIASNFPLIFTPCGDNPFYGKDRYAYVSEHIDDVISVADAFRVLKMTSQEGQWATRVSFVYSGKENCVYYCRERDFSDIKVHRFGGKHG